MPLLEAFSEFAIQELTQQGTVIAAVLDPYMGPTWILYGHYVDPYIDVIWNPIWILYRSFYGYLHESYMDPYMDLIWIL